MITQGEHIQVHICLTFVLSQPAAMMSILCGDDLVNKNRYIISRYKVTYTNFENLSSIVEASISIIQGPKREKLFLRKME